MTTTSPAPAPAPPTAWWRRLRWRVVAASTFPAALLLLGLFELFTRPDWPEAKIFAAIGSALLVLGALAQLLADSDEIKKSQGVTKDAFVLCGWLLVVTGAAFTFVGVLAS